jgi:hypothetical protein
MLASPSVVHIAPSPVDANAILLVSHKSSFLYRVADESPDAQLEVRAEIAHGDGVVTRQFAWHAATTDSHPSVAQLCATHLLIRDSSRLAETPLYTRHLRDAGLTSEAAWNPHKLNELALTAGKAVVGVDTRLSGDAAAAWTVPEADLVQALSVDFNPTAVHYMACGGVDGIVRIFDLRRTAEPALRLKNHQHWVTALRYSIFNDQMLLTAGADNSLKVYSIWSTSAAKQAAQRQAGGADDEQTQRQTAEAASRAKDKLALDITEHEDAVRTVAWAAGNKRLFASGSYTGRVVLTLMQ